MIFSFYCWAFLPIFKKTWALITAGLLLFACAVHGQTADSALARQFLQWHNMGKFSEAHQLFSPTAQRQVTTAMLEEVWKKYMLPHGKYQGISHTQEIRRDTLTQVVDVCEFDEARITVVFSFTPAHRLAGYHIMGIQPRQVDRIPPPPHTHQIDTLIIVPGGHIAGSLLLPEKTTKFPIVLIIAGSGSVDRDGNTLPMVSSNSYRMLADSLAVHGIASLRYDKRYVGQSIGFDKPGSAVEFNDYVKDAIALIRFLKKDPRFSKVILIGHSEGSLIGMLAAEKTVVNAFISLAGAGEPIDQILQWQLASQPGADSSFRQKVTQLLDSLRSGRLVENIPASLRGVFAPSVQPFLISWMKYNPAHEISQLHIPILLVNGTTDLQVTSKQAQLLHAARPDATLAIIPGMNHVLKNAPETREANLATYLNPALPLHPTLVQTLLHFIRINEVANLL